MSHESKPKTTEDSKATVRMKYVGRFKGLTKLVELPVPLLSHSMKLDESLSFTRTQKNGPAWCEVPLEWVGALLAVGGNWQLAEPLTPDLKGRIDAAKGENEARMKQFALENELVEV